MANMHHVNAAALMSGAAGGANGVLSSWQKLSGMTEATWTQIGRLAELMGDHDKALTAFEFALRHNPYSLGALAALGHSFRQREIYNKVRKSQG